MIRGHLWKTKSWTKSMLFVKLFPHVLSMTFTNLVNTFAVAERNSKNKASVLSAKRIWKSDNKPVKCNVPKCKQFYLIAFSTERCNPNGLQYMETHKLIENTLPYLKYFNQNHFSRFDAIFFDSRNTQWQNTKLKTFAILHSVDTGTRGKRRLPTPF